MIGTATDELISGYDTPKIDDSAKEVGVLKVEAKARIVLDGIKVLQQTLIDSLCELRKVERTAKTNAEDLKNEKMATLERKIAATKDKKEKEQFETQQQRYLFKTYVPKLRTIGLSKAKIETGLVTPMQAALREFKALEKQLDPYNLKQAKLEWVPAGNGYRYVLTVLGQKFVLLCLYKGGDGYSIVTTAGTDGCLRDVYQKRLGRLADSGDFKKGTNEYVKDDNGIFTRRWAWGYKTLGACEALMNPGGVMKGRYVVAGHKIKDVDADLKKMYKLANEKTELTTEEMLFVHQEKGSSDQQRGICLTSSPDKLIHGNKGKTFAKDEASGKENILLKVDLAKVPKDQELLFNLYTQDAQARTIGLAGTKPSGEDFDAQWAKWHTDTSTAKNREIYLRELTQDEVANLEDVKVQIASLR